MRNSTMCLKVISEGENRENGKDENIPKLWFQVFKNCKMMMSSLIVKAYHVPSKINKCELFPQKHVEKLHRIWKEKKRRVLKATREDFLGTSIDFRRQGTSIFKVLRSRPVY